MTWRHTNWLTLASLYSVTHKALKTIEDTKKKILNCKSHKLKAQVRILQQWFRHMNFKCKSYQAIAITTTINIGNGTKQRLKNEQNNATKI